MNRSSIFYKSFYWFAEAYRHGCLVMMYYAFSSVCEVHLAASVSLHNGFLFFSLPLSPNNISLHRFDACLGLDQRKDCSHTKQSNQKFFFHFFR